MSFRGRLSIGISVFNGRMQRASNFPFPDRQKTAAHIAAVKGEDLLHEQLGHAHMRGVKDLAR